MKRDSQNTFLYENTAVALILAGDEAGYQEHCQSMLKLQWDMADPKIVDSLCTTCLLGPNAIDPAELPVDVLENAISDSVWEPYWPWFRVGRALLSYREGKHQESLVWTDVKGDESKSPKVAIACRLGIRAMAQQQLGQTETARQTLQAAKSIIPVDVRNLGVDLGSRPAPSAVVYSRWLIAECLRRQAASLIEN